MRFYMRQICTGFCLVIAFVSVLTAQENGEKSPAGKPSGKYVISAEAGGVNFTEGRVSIMRADGRSGLLIKGDSVAIGDRVFTESDGRAEILLNPGSYLRVGQNTEFSFKSTSLDDLTIDLKKGSAVLEIFAADEFAVTVDSPGTRFMLVESGVYRIDANGQNSTLAVWKGKAFINRDGEELKVKKGKEATVSGEQLAIAKFDRDEKDTLDIWSKSRAKELAKLNSSFKPRGLRDPLLNAFNSNRLSLYDSFGLWVYDPFRRSYGFLPFGSGWSSPYGYWFNYDIWSYRLPRTIIFNSPVVARRATTVTGTAPTAPVPAGNTRRTATAPSRRRFEPPFVRIQGRSSITGRGGVSTVSGGPRPAGRVVQSPSIIVRPSGGTAAPPPTRTKTETPRRPNKY